MNKLIIDHAVSIWYDHLQKMNQITTDFDLELCVNDIMTLVHHVTPDLVGATREPRIS